MPRSRPLLGKPIPLPVQKKGLESYQGKKLWRMCSGNACYPHKHASTDCERAVLCIQDHHHHAPIYSAARLGRLLYLGLRWVKLMKSAWNMVRPSYLPVNIVHSLFQPLIFRCLKFDRIQELLIRYVFGFELIPENNTVWSDLPAILNWF